MTLLARAAERFDDEAALNAFFAAHPQVEQFCRFMALRAANGGTPWNTWTVDTPDAATLRTWRFTQYIFFTQWTAVKVYANRRGISVIGDVPIYVAWDSADVWAAPGSSSWTEIASPLASRAFRPIISVPMDSCGAIPSTTGKR